MCGLLMCIAMCCPGDVLVVRVPSAYVRPTLAPMIWHRLDRCVWALPEEER
jgi:hypothetical protein